MKRSALFFALFPAFAAAAGEAHVSGTIHLAYVEPSGSSGAWKPLAPENATVRLDVSDGPTSAPLFDGESDGVVGRSLGPLVSPNGKGQVGGQSRVTKSPAMTYAFAEMSASYAYSDGVQNFSQANFDERYSENDFENAGLEAGERADVYGQITLRKGSGLSATDGQGLFCGSLGMSPFQRSNSAGAYAVLGFSGLNPDPHHADRFDPMLTSDFKIGQGQDDERMEVYLLGSNADDPSVDPEARWSADDALRIDTLSATAVRTLVSTYFDADGTLLRDISVGLRYRNLPIGATNGNASDPIFRIYGGLAAGAPVPEPAPCLALGLGTIAVLRRRKWQRVAR